MGLYAKIITTARGIFNRDSTRYTVGGVQVLTDVAYFETGKGLMIGEGTTNIASSAQSRCVSGWVFGTDSGKITWTENAGGEEKITGVVGTTLTGDGYAQIQFNGLAYQGLPISWGVSIEVTGRTAGSIYIYIFDKQGGAYESAGYTLPSGDVSGRYILTKTLRNPIDSDANSLICRVALGVGVNAGTTVTIRRAQVEQKAYSTSWQIGGTPRTAESYAIPIAKQITKGDWAISVVFEPTTSQLKSAWVWVIYIDANNYWSVATHPTGRIYLAVRSGGVSVTTYSASDAVLSADVSYRITARGNGATMALWANGVKSSAGNVSYVEPVGNLPANLYLGSSSAAAAQANGFYKELAFMRALSDIKLAALTTPITLNEDILTYYPLASDFTSQIPLSLVKSQEVSREIQMDEHSTGGNYLRRDVVAVKSRRVWDLESIVMPKIHVDSLYEYLESIFWAAVTYWMDEFGTETNTISVYIDPPKETRIPAGIDGKWYDDARKITIRIKEASPQS